MSTILKALKKLEREQETRPSSGAASAIPDFNASQSVQQTAKQIRFRGLGLKMSIVAGVLVALGAVVYFYPSNSSPVHPQASRQVQQTARSRATASPARPSDHAEAQISKPRTAFSAGTAKTGFEGQRRDSHPRKSFPVAEPGKFESTSRMKDLASQTEPSAKPQKPPVPKEPPASPKGTESPAALPTIRVPRQASKESDLYAGTERLRDGRLKVQAIAWSSDAGDRMAVINNRVVREGDTLESFTILAIEPDEVVAKEGPKLWKVAFGSP